MEDLIGPNQISMREHEPASDDVLVFNSSKGDQPPLAVAKKESTAHG